MHVRYGCCPGPRVLLARAPFCGSRAHPPCVPACTAQGYVQARIEQILSAFSHALASNIPGLSSDVVSASRNTALAAVPPPEYAVARRQLQLVFRHDCMCVVVVVD